MKLVALLPAALVAAWWWLMAAVILPSTPLTRALAIGLAAIAGAQLFTFTICGLRCRRAGWGTTLALGALLLLGSALLFFTPVVGLPFYALALGFVGLTWLVEKLPERWVGPRGP